MHRSHRITPARLVGEGTKSARPTSLAVSLAALMLVGIVAACSASATPNLPTSLPSQAPSVFGALPSSAPSGSSACVDATTMGIITQVQAQGADATSIVSQNKDAIVAGLQAFQPSDQTTATWRDQVVAALQSGDFAGAAEQIKSIGSSGVTLHTC